MSKSAGSSDAVKVGFSILGEVEVDNNVDCLDINTTSQEIRTHKIATHSVAEVMEDTIAVCLQHAGVTVEARIA